MSAAANSYAARRDETEFRDRRKIARQARRTANTTVRFITPFEKKSQAEELLTLALENGAWRTTGYQIK
jgi:hypothetical protein